MSSAKKWQSPNCNCEESKENSAIVLQFTIVPNERKFSKQILFFWLCWQTCGPEACNGTTRIETVDAEGQAVGKFLGI